MTDARIISVKFLEFDFEPMALPVVFDRYKAINDYARRYVNGAKDHYSFAEYVEQVCADFKDPSVAPDVKREIRRLERLGRGGY